MADPRWPPFAVHKSILLLSDVLVYLKKYSIKVGFHIKIRPLKLNGIIYSSFPTS